MSNPSDSSTRTDEESVNRPVLKSKYQKPSSLVHTLKTMRMDEVPEVYPPVGYLVAETEEIRAAWEEHLKSAPFSDPRSANETRRQIVMMDFEKINYTVPEGESVEIQDFKTDKILIAVKQKVFGRKTVQNANGGVLDHLNQSKGTRADDPGIMANVGYTAGLRNKSNFAWAKNLLGEQTKTDQLSHKTPCWLTQGWNLAQPYFPKEVVEDYNKVRTAVGGVGMGAGQWARGKDNTVPRYIIPEEEADYLYETSDLAPPCANLSKNYVKETHKDSNANTFGASITTSRTKPTSCGDQLVIFDVSKPHGTTLPLCDPLDKNPEFNQSGMSFTIPRGILSAYKKAVERMSNENSAETEIPVINSENSIAPIRLDDFHVKPKLRATMEPIKRREALDLPDCPETKKYRSMKKSELVEEMKNRVRAGSKVSFSTSNKKKEEIIEALLRDDGILVDSVDLASN